MKPVRAAKNIFTSGENTYWKACIGRNKATSKISILIPLLVGAARSDNPVSFASESYSREELIAEMTAAVLCGIAGIEQKTLGNSAAYLKTWIARLKSDSRLLVSAASQSQKAADFIQGKLVHQEGEGQPVGVDSIQHDPTLANTLT
jgi:hypothetical protein